MFCIINCMYNLHQKMIIEIITIISKENLYSNNTDIAAFTVYFLNCYFYIIFADNQNVQ